MGPMQGSLALTFSPPSAISDQTPLTVGRKRVALNTATSQRHQGRNMIAREGSEGRQEWQTIGRRAIGPLAPADSQ